MQEPQAWVVDGISLINNTTGVAVRLDNALTTKESRRASSASYEKRSDLRSARSVSLADPD